jgi:hypothetical protein
MFLFFALCKLFWIDVGTPGHKLPPARCQPISRLRPNINGHRRSLLVTEMHQAAGDALKPMPGAGV